MLSISNWFETWPHRDINSLGLQPLICRDPPADREEHDDRSGDFCSCTQSTFYLPQGRHYFFGPEVKLDANINMNASDHMLSRADGVDWVQLIRESVSLPTILGPAIALIFTVALYRRFLSPIKDIPGPFWASITRFWHVKIIIDGNQNVRLRDAHEKYGPFVRMAPNEVSVTHPDGVKRLLLQALPKVRPMSSG